MICFSISIAVVVAGVLPIFQGLEQVNQIFPRF